MTTGYIIFPDLKSAQDRSHAEALARGCKENDVTQFWWSVVPHPKVDGQALLLLDDNRTDFDKSKLTVSEKASVVTDLTILADAGAVSKDNSG